MYKHQEQVREFHRKFDHPIAGTLTIPSEAHRILRIRCLLEEVLELAKASRVAITVESGQVDLEMEDFGFRISSEAEVDFVQVADALADIQYFNDGTCLVYGIDLEPVFDEVHRANMSKVWPDGTVHKDEGGKIIKPPNFVPPDVKSVLGL